MADVQWYYARNDQQFGPVSAGELKVLADAGRLAPDDLLWREGMEQWATAINLKGLFASEPETSGIATPSPVNASQAAGNPTTSNTTTSTQTPVVQVTVNRPLGSRTSAVTQPTIGTQAVRPLAPRAALQGVLRTTQLILWTTCVLVVLTGMVLFTRAFLKAETATEEATAAAVFATFFIGAYVLARSGEKLSRLLLRRRR